MWQRRIKIIFLACVIFAAAFDLWRAYAQAVFQFQDHATVPLHSLGYPFMGLESLFKDVPGVGYYTDQTIDSGNPLATAQFELAQYMLAPTVLDLNHPRWRWDIFACTSPQTALEAIKRLGLVPLKTNHGIILAYNPRGID
ncbi:MAG: hypothetical protein KGJ09_03810 [Candidatus Omnitrophica bacterium]|nr:hypothetical protein [Candidatus Omnitrophota bacterium]MDE2009186.1 hypothetical protein [Candidatus Omnitrophota bacterium]MDE2213707.1 hypothetical protein [Candidatus Omnitrophota bacterium]MDE2230718.1 hypothetical protein [Candidatus Omnitrophota bacterium]